MGKWLREHPIGAWFLNLLTAILIGLIVVSYINRKYGQYCDRVDLVYQNTVKIKEGFDKYYDNLEKEEENERDR